MTNDDPLSVFHPLVATWFREEVGAPTPVQERSWPAIRRGEHCLITAPTGTGKTLAAFLTAIDARIKGETGRVLYVSPLKALNNDIERNLQRPLGELRERFAVAREPFPEIRVGVRSGDTDQAERRKLTTNPPEILVTTPESLNLMLSSQGGLRGLRDFSVVILDEIHAVLSSKRGTYLMGAVERLVTIFGEVQRIALSATVRPLSTVAEIVGAYRLDRVGEEVSYTPRPVSVIEVEGQKRYDLEVVFPDTVGDHAGAEEWWGAIVRYLRSRIAVNRSTLIFANSRRAVEKLARLVNEEGGDPIYAHHGSLSKEIRRVVEERLKRGELKAIVATSSLELGIDIGEIDEVILVQSPFAVSSGIQRVGRAGHGVGATSKGALLPLQSRDLIESAVMSESIREGASEPIRTPEQPLDVLAQFVLSMALFDPVSVGRLYDTVRCIHAYRDLSRREFDLVVEMLAGRFSDSRLRELHPRINFDRLRGTILARKGAAMLLYMSGGVIPDRGYYTLRDSESGAKLGELDEEFVWERSVGDAFPLGNRAWRITGITPNEVEVVPIDDVNSIIPFWRAEEVSRPAGFSERIGAFLETAESELETEDFLRLLEERHSMTARAAKALVDYLSRQRTHTGCPLPHRHHLVVERYADPGGAPEAHQVILHTLWGSAINRPLAYALAAAWKEAFGYSPEVYTNNDAVLFNLPHEFSTDALLELVREDDIPRLLRNSIEGGSLFGARFRENAQRSLLLPRRHFSQRTPLWLNRMRSKKLLETVSTEEEFPVTLETWRECLRYEFDLPGLYRLLGEVRTGEITVSEVFTPSPSPFADSIIWRQTNFQMYEDDSASSSLRTATGDDLIEEILGSQGLRPDIPEDLAESFRRKVQRLETGYSPDSAEELAAWVAERLFIPKDEWAALLAAIRDDSPDRFATITEEAADRLHTIRDGSEDVGVVAVERLPFLRVAWGELDAPVNGSADTDSADGAEALFHFLTEWFRYYGPVSLSWVIATVPAPRATLDRAMDELVREGVVIIDRITAGATEMEVCERENLERLLRRRRAAARPDLEPLSARRLQLFVATFQGASLPGSSQEDLERRLEVLFGYPARAQLWESEILPARLSPYYRAWLDTAMRRSELIWFGCGPQKIAFAFESDLDLFGERRGESSADGDKLSGAPPAVEELDDSADAISSPEQRVAQVLSSGGRHTFFDLTSEAGCTTEEAASALWSLAWAGRASNDGMDALRQGVENGFTPEHVRTPSERSERGHAGRRARPGRRAAFSRWKTSRPMDGDWISLQWPDSSGDALEESERIKDRIRVLFARYGILYREIVKNELPLLQWSTVVRTLRLLELSGEVVGGHFVAGLRGLQFVSPAALRALTSSLPEDAVYWLNAADPASLCGIEIDEIKAWLPPRVPSTHLVFHGEKLVLVSRKNGRDLTCHVSPDLPRFSDYLGVFEALVAREQSPIKRVRVERINGVQAFESEYAERLRAFGFVGDGSGLSLWKRY